MSSGACARAPPDNLGDRTRIILAVTEPTSPWVLRPFACGSLPERVPIDAAGATFGRAPSNTLALAEALFPHVSNHHARITLDGDGAPVVEDLGSRNGTFVNDTRVQRALLRDGDI